MSVITEAAFVDRLHEALRPLRGLYAWVSGPGRSGAIAAAYASHLLDIPFVPYGHTSRIDGTGLLIDIADISTGRLEKTAQRYGADVCLLFTVEIRRHPLWYETQPPIPNVRIFERKAS